MRQSVRAAAVLVVLAGFLAACGSPAARPVLVSGLPAASESPASGDSTSAGAFAPGVTLPDMPAEVDQENVGRAAATPSPTATASSVMPRRTLPTASPLPRRPPAQPLVPQSGTRTFTGATGNSSVLGDGATRVTYVVQLEGGIPGWTPESFAAKVDTVLADSRSWRASHTWSFQRVPAGTTPSVYIRLATPDTVDYYCGLAGVDTEGKYSCRYGKYVVINLLRWTLAVPGFGIDLAGYRAMVTNHELGHFLGYNHQACPAAGGLAPVMQTQTIALNGCLPNGWPYPDGVHFVSGPPAPA